MNNWYPGHMAKARQMLKENARLIDILIEVVDARIPFSSHSPDLLQSFSFPLAHIIVLNKEDLASPGITDAWKNYFSAPTFSMNSSKGRGLNSLTNYLENIQPKNDKFLKLMVMGIPNVGKSTLINCFSNRKKVKTGKAPGITRGKQWLKVSNHLSLLDTPGILSPNRKSQETETKLAIIGSIPEKNYDKELIAYKLIKYILNIDKDVLQERYKIRFETDQPYDILPLIGANRGCYLSGGRIDRNRAATAILKDFREGKLGRISLEKPGNLQGDNNGD